MRVGRPFTLREMTGLAEGPLRQVVTGGRGAGVRAPAESTLEARDRFYS